MKYYEQIVEQIKKIIELDTNETEWFLSLFEKKTYKKKEWILRSGEVCKYETFVLKGCLKIFYTDQQGTDNTVKFAIENWWALDLQSFETQTPAFYSIQTLEDTITFRISRENHLLLYEKIPKFEKYKRMMYQNAYILLQHRMTQQLFEVAEEKYQHFTDKYPGLELRISQKEIASYLGITPEFLSMLRKKRMEQSIS
ncbi:Crp/Fnr family transcriptional regulator [bacterium]|nr:MAG: Crp/Fnr family transcriptional regulator [bacterium]